MIAAVATCMLMAGAPAAGFVAPGRPATCERQHRVAPRGDAIRTAIPKEGSLEARLANRRSGARRSASQSGHAGGDSIWNGVLIGAALGVVAILTTAAEAPPSGKAASVVMIAALGGYVDSRLAVTGAVRRGPEARGRRLVLSKSVRF